VSIPIHLTNMPVLPKAEQDELAVQAKHGNDAAGRRLIESNLGLILLEMHGLVDEYVAKWDLLAAGVHGMNEAIDKYEIERGHFATFAMYYVRMRMMRERRNARQIRVPEGTCYRLRKVASGKCENTPKLTHTATLASRARRISSIDAPMHADGPTLADVLESDAVDPATAAERSLDIKAMAKAMDKLEPRQSMILRMRFGLDCDKRTLEQIAQLMSISRERVRQLQNAAIKDLRELIDRPTNQPKPKPEAPAAPQITSIYRYGRWYIARYTDGEYWPLTAHLKRRARVGRRWAEELKSFLMLTPAARLKKKVDKLEV